MLCGTASTSSRFNFSSILHIYIFIAFQSNLQVAYHLRASLVILAVVIPFDEVPRFFLGDLWRGCARATVLQKRETFFSVSFLRPCALIFGVCFSRPSSLGLKIMRESNKQTKTQNLSNLLQSCIQFAKMYEITVRKVCMKVYLDLSSLPVMGHRTQ